MELSVQAYAKSIGKSRWTVYRMIQKNTLPAGVESKVIAGHIVIIKK